MEQNKGEILHLFVIGFHHKKGCQIEFSYPEIETLPEEWRHLPSLAMPDGAHNYEHDAVYFHLPSLNEEEATVFGVSCFQQIPIEKVKNRTTDMTRGTIQKAICVLSTLPLFGYLQIKMELVTAAFFDEADFSNVSLLKDAFHHLNDCLSNSYSQHLLDGLSVRDVVLKFRHRTLLLFKLMLLERRVIFFNSPVKPMCCTLLSLISLHPGLLEKGLFKSFSPMTNCNSSDKEDKYVIEKLEEVVPKSEFVKQSHDDSKGENGEDDILHENIEKLKDNTNDDGSDMTTVESVKDVKHCHGKEQLENKSKKMKGGQISEEIVDYLIEDYFQEIDHARTLESGCPTISSEIDYFPGESPNGNHNANYLHDLDLENYGLPLSIFTEGNLFLPYISISYLDFLIAPEVRGFHGGAANLLFKQKKQIIDVLVELESSKIETSCPELRRQLFLTTEDLRFAERLVRSVLEPNIAKGDFTSDEWIRMQFTLYMLSLLRTSLMDEGSRELDHFNIHFINAWKNTNNYKIWRNLDIKAIWNLSPGHPSAGNLSVSDVRLRFSQAMTNTESGRRINQAVTSTGKAVGGAITQARGALSTWWSNLTTQEPKPAKAVNNV